METPADARGKTLLGLQNQLAGSATRRRRNKPIQVTEFVVKCGWDAPARRLVVYVGIFFAFPCMRSTELDRRMLVSDEWASVVGIFMYIDYFAHSSTQFGAVAC